LRAFIEEHAAGKVLLRVKTRLRPALRGVIVLLTLATLSVMTASAAIALRWPWLSAVCVATAAIALGHALWEATRGVAVVRQATLRAISSFGMIPVPIRSTDRATHRLNPRPVSVRQAAQGLVAVALVTSMVATVSSLADEVRTVRAPSSDVAEAAAPEPTLDLRGALAVAPNGDLILADAATGVIHRFDTRPFDRPLRPTSTSVFLRDMQASAAGLAFASPADVAVASNGDLFVADPANHRICRIDPASGKIITIAGYGLAGFDGDDVQATQTALNRPNAVAVAANGDLYVADTSITAYA
jgi:hypothetical protein